MADLNSLADDAARRLAVIANRAATVARGVLLLTIGSVGVAYLVGCLVIPGGWRYVWIIGGFVLCAIPVVSIWTGYRRLRKVPRTFDAARAELTGLLGDERIRAALFELVDRDEEQDQRAALLTLGQELNTLRKLLNGHKDDAFDVWEDVVAITSLPGQIGIAMLGSFTALIFSVIAVLASAIF